MPKNIKDEDIYLTIKSSRHNQIVSLLADLDETNLDNSTSSPNSKVHDTLNDDKENDISQKNNISVIQDETSFFTETIDIPSEPDFSENPSSSSSDMFSDTSESSKQSTDSSSDNTSKGRNNKSTLKKKKKKKIVKSKAVLSST